MANWFSPVDWRAAAVCSPAIPVILVIGLAIGQFPQSIIAAGSAMSVGFGANRQIQHQRFVSMILVTTLMSFATLAGSLIASHDRVYLVVCAVASGIVAISSFKDQTLWWILAQALVAYMLSGSYPSDFEGASTRAALAAIGGLCQISSVALLTTFFPSLSETIPPQPPQPVQSRAFVYLSVLRVALGVPLALVLARFVEPSNSYWAPMTALFVLKPNFSDTLGRSVARLAGTFAGCLFASPLAILAGNRPSVMIPAVGLAAAVAIALQRAHYAAMTFGITCVIVLMLDMAQGNPEANAAHRLLATVVGGVVALILSFIGQRK